MLPPVIAQTRVLGVLASEASAGSRDDLLRLGARFAEYAGWMAQESGQEKAALWLTARAVTMAEAGNDHDPAVYALIRRALVTLYRGDARQTVALARQAQAHSATPPRIREPAAQREAQGHALAGDHDACMRSLDRARELLGAPGGSTGAPVLGTTNQPDTVTTVTGWCLYELGRPKEAGEILDAQVARIRPEALRSRTRYGVRQALTHAAAGEIELNYRTSDEEDVAALLEHALSERFASNVFFRASKSIKPGDDFEAELLKGVRTGSALLAVIGPRWLEVRDEHGVRKIDKASDWVRREIVEAFDLGIRVVPVLIGEAKPLPKDALPAGLERLATCQYVRLRSRD